MDFPLTAKPTRFAIRENNIHVRFNRTVRSHLVHA